MLTSLTLRNFKVFKQETTFRFSKINLLTGINGRGKSSLLQAMLLFKQSEANLSPKLSLNGGYVQLGKFADVKNIETSIKESINIEFEMEDAWSKETVNFFFTEIENDSLAMRANRILYKKNLLMPGHSVSTSIYIKNGRYWAERNEEPPQELTAIYFFCYPDKLYNLHYISADRLGPQNFYTKAQSPFFSAIDKTGSNLATIASKRKHEPISAELCIAQNEWDGVKMQSPTHTLETQIGNWLGYITDTDNVSIAMDSTSNDYIITLKFIFDGKEFKPANVGFGYSYILPIVISGLIAKQGEIFIIENPEAHLHPKAQSRLARFLARVAASGVQVFVESHSDHILNALRVEVKRGELKPEDVNVLYFSKNKIVTPKIDEDGRIDLWEDGFFDEWDNNLMELL